MTQDILQDVIAGLAAERPDAIVWAPLLRALGERTLGDAAPKHFVDALATYSDQFDTWPELAYSLEGEQATIRLARWLAAGCRAHLPPDDPIAIGARLFELEDQVPSDLVPQLRALCAMASVGLRRRIARFLAARCLEAGAWVEARDALTLVPPSPTTQRMLGAALLGLGEIDAGVAQLDAALSETGDNPLAAIFGGQRSSASRRPHDSSRLSYLTYTKQSLSGLEERQLAMRDLAAYARTVEDWKDWRWQKRLVAAGLAENPTIRDRLEPVYRTDLRQRIEWYPFAPQVVAGLAQRGVEYLDQLPTLHDHVIYDILDAVPDLDDVQRAEIGDETLDLAARSVGNLQSGGRFASFDALSAAVLAAASAQGVKAERTKNHREQPCVRVTMPRVGSVEISEDEGMLISSRSERGSARLAALARRLMRGA